MQQINRKNIYNISKCSTMHIFLMIMNIFKEHDHAIYATQYLYQSMHKTKKLRALHYFLRGQDLDPIL